MLAFTTPVTVPNLTKVRVAAVQLDSDALVATVTAVVQGAGQVPYGVYTLTIKDDTSTGLRATAAPLGFSDRMEVFATPSVGAFTALVAAYTGAIVARNKAAETSLQSIGLLPAGTVT